MAAGRPSAKLLAARRRHRQSLSPRHVLRNDDRFHKGFVIIFRIQTVHGTQITELRFGYAEKTDYDIDLDMILTVAAPTLKIGIIGIDI